jgi:hypothetical protein
METYKHTCEKCGYQTNSNKPFYNHTHRRKFSCNKDYDNKILLLAYEKIKTFETSKIDYDVIYEENDYKLYIRRSCFYNTPYFEDYFIRFDKPNGVHVTFFAEWNKKGELIFAKK